MILVSLDFWSILVYAFLMSILWIGYRLTWRLAYGCETFIIGLARLGMHSLAKGILNVLIGYTHQTYQKSRFVVWNQVPVRFFALWSIAFILTSLILLFRISPIIWLPLALGYSIYRVIQVWLKPALPPIHTQDPALKRLIQDVNEQFRPALRSVQPVIRQWDYLDELFA